MTEQSIQIHYTKWGRGRKREKGLIKGIGSSSYRINQPIGGQSRDYTAMENSSMAAQVQCHENRELCGVYLISRSKPWASGRWGKISESPRVQRPVILVFWCPKAKEEQCRSFWKAIGYLASVFPCDLCSQNTECTFTLGLTSCFSQHCLRQMRAGLS